MTALPDETLPALNFPQSLHGLLDNKVGIVTGNSHGIGAATAIAFAEAGAVYMLVIINGYVLPSQLHA